VIEIVVRLNGKCNYFMYSPLTHAVVSGFTTNSNCGIQENAWTSLFRSIPILNAQSCRHRQSRVGERVEKSGSSREPSSVILAVAHVVRISKSHLVFPCRALNPLIARPGLLQEQLRPLCRDRRQRSRRTLRERSQRQLRPSLSSTRRGH